MQKTPIQAYDTQVPEQPGKHPMYNALAAHPEKKAAQVTAPSEASGRNERRHESVAGEEDPGAALEEMRNSD